MIYKIGKALFWIIFHLAGIKIEGKENIPAEGPLLVAGNHVSNWDPIIINVAMNRPVWYMGKAELFRNPFMNILMKAVQVFPIERGKGDLQAIRTAMGYLQSGKALGIFPEGTRNQNHDSSQIGGGLGLLSCKGNAPVLPVAVIGSDHIFPCGWFHPLKVKIGQPISFELEPGQKKNSENFVQFSQNVMQNIYSML